MNNIISGTISGTTNSTWDYHLIKKSGVAYFDGFAIVTIALAANGNYDFCRLSFRPRYSFNVTVNCGGIRAYGYVDSDGMLKICNNDLLPANTIYRFNFSYLTG